MNSNEFTDFDTKIENSDLKINKPKNLTFQVLLVFFKETEKA